jgi:predicted DCC family thiol-disulfide oxidoreductase YuxK
VHAMSEWRFKLLYDGQCPFCRLEARWLQRWNRHGRLVFEDISTPEFDSSRYGVTREDVMGIIHGVFPDGRIVRKVEAFRQAYRAVGLGWLLAPTGWPVLRWVFDGFYALFARYRVSVGRLIGGSCATGSCGVAARAHKRHPHT